MEGETARRLRPVDAAERQQERPAIWVCSLADYHASVLYGGWVDAAQEPDELARSIRALLQDSPTEGASDWAILNQRGFHCLRLRHDESLTTVSRLGRGLLRYGEPFAHLALYAGYENDRVLGSFEDRYLGHFASTDAYVAHVVAETERYRDLAKLPPSVRSCARFAIENLARQWADHVVVAEATEGGVYLFDAEC